MGSQQTPDAVASAAFPRAEPRASSHTTAHHALNSNFDLLPVDSMAASGFLPPSTSIPSDHLQQSSRPFGMPSNKLDQGLAPRPIGTPSSVTQILMRRLPPDTSEQSLQLMFVWSTELLDLKLLPVDKSYEDGSRSALLTFSTHGGAVDAREKLNGRAVQSNGADGMILEIIPKAVDRQGSTNGSPPGEPHSAASSTASSASGSRQPSRVNGRLQSIDGIGAPMGNGYGARDLSGNDTSPPLPSSMNRQPPIGSQRTERSSISSKALINGDSTADDETNDLIWNSVSFAENGIFTEPRANSQRRATAPQIPFTAAMASLSLNTNNNANSSPQPASLPQHYSSASAHNIVSPLSSAASPLPFPGANHHFGRPLPAVNPADQNPPCNTLYVGNLPLDTSEEELKATFSKQRGYKRLCFRTKANGPMCFVEFEDISFATKALHDLYGHMLHNSTKGGIRLSFSKNPLGVRSGHGNHQASSGQIGHMNHMMSPNNNHFSTANGPPPGLAAPPGLSGGRAPYQANGHNHNSLHSFPNGHGRNNGWNRGHINDNHLGSNNGFPSSSGFVPPHMMGR